MALRESNRRKHGKTPAVTHNGCANRRTLPKGEIITTRKTRSPDLAQDVSPRVRGLFLKNLADFQTELARIQAGFLPAFAVWRQRKEFSERVFRSLRRVQDLRLRGRELGVSFQEMHFSGSVAGRVLLDDLCEARNPADLLQAGVAIVHRALITAIADYLARNDGVYDLPSQSLLEADRDELQSQITWAETALAEISEQIEDKPDSAYVRRIEMRCVELTELLREHDTRGGVPLRTGRRIGTLPLSEGCLPLGFRRLEFGPDPLPEKNVYSDRERFHATNFLQEVQAADSCAATLFDSPDMPWEFYLDISRQMWDESRHAMFGERKLRDLGTTAAATGLSTKAYAMRQTLTPLDRYAALTTQEADAFPGKHAGLKDAVENNDTLSAMAWSYDIADETQHVRFGTKWIPVMIELTQEPRNYEQVKDDARNWRQSVLARVYMPVVANLRQ